MLLSATVRTSLYKDSVALMRIAEGVLELPGVRRATLLMGTPANKAMLADAGLFHEALETARPGDLMIVVAAETPQAADAATAECLRLLDGPAAASATELPAEAVARSIAMAHPQAPDASLAQISVPGPYAAAEALKALRRGLDVFLFSDNVPLAQERAVKRIARDKGLMVMGPDCGTAIIGGTPVGFANVVRTGTISLVGASGTGLQAVTCRIHALGAGVRHAIGTGGRDVSDEIGGITLHQALERLAGDAGTEVIVIVSKPPGRLVAQRVLEQVRTFAKPVVVLFLGEDLTRERLPQRIVAVDTLEDAAVAAVGLAQRDGIRPQAHERERTADGRRDRTHAGADAASTVRPLFGRDVLHRSAARLAQPRPRRALECPDRLGGERLRGRRARRARPRQRRVHRRPAASDDRPRNAHRKDRGSLAGSNRGGDRPRRGAGLRRAPRPGRRARALDCRSACAGEDRGSRPCRHRVRVRDRRGSATSVGAAGDAARCRRRRRLRKHGGRAPRGRNRRAGANRKSRVGHDFRDVEVNGERAMKVETDPGRSATRSIARRRRIVVAFGGNASYPPTIKGLASEQFALMAQACTHLVRIVESGYQLVLTHGNGPVVGNILFRMARTAHELPPMPMDICVAHSQGGMGYMLQQTLANALRDRGLRKVGQLRSSRRSR